jgi:hypothetical protein
LAAVTPDGPLYDGSTISAREMTMQIRGVHIKKR